MRAGALGVRVALVAGLALSTLAASPGPPRDYADPESAIRFAFAPSDLAAAREGDRSTYAALDAYLAGVLARIEASPAWRDRQEPHVEISAGSDYQVMVWLQQGEVDAAVVTPFMARLLLAQEAAVPIVELVPRAGPDSPDGLGDPRGHWPVVWSPAIPPPVEEDEEGGDGGADAEPEPWQLGALFQLGGFLQEAEQDAAARADGFASMPATSYDARFVSHLSTDGFAAPVACAARWIEIRKQEHTWSRTRQDRVETRFWTSLLERSSFTFDAAETVRFDAPAERIPIRFAPVRPPPSPEREPWEARAYAPTTSCGGSSRIGLLPDDRGDATPPIPNDVVVITPHLARELGFGIRPVALPEYDPDSGERKPATAAGARGDPPPCVSPDAAAAPWLPGWSTEVCDLWLPPEGARALEDGTGDGTGYAAVQPLQAATWDAFEREIYAPFEAPGVLRGWLDSLYREGLYPFGLGDLTRLLRHDQAGEREPGAALVLPGGGVKSAYQARILDILYQTYMTNADGRSSGSDDDERLRVRHVVGTSGGAIVGLLAAQTPPYGCSDLTSLWTQVRSSRDVFPFLNLLRALSVLVLVALLSGVLSLVVWRYRDADPPVAAGDVSVPLVAFLLLIVVLAPLIVASVIEREDLASLSLAGVLYIATVAAAHFALHAVVRKTDRSATSHSTRRAQAIAFTVVSALAIVLSIHLASGGNGIPLPSGRWRAPAVAAAFLALQLGILGVSVGRRKSLVLPKGRPTLYLQAMALVAAYVAVTYGLVALLAGAGFTPLFEITGRFWGFLLLCGLLVAGAIVAWSGPAPEKELWFGATWKGFRRWMTRAVSYLVQGDPSRRRVPPPRASLVALFAAALAWWTVCLGHSLYTSEVSFRFIDRVARARAAHAAPGSPPLHANLVVTGSALERSCGDQGPPLPAGDFYFCFSAPGGCPAVRNPRWHDGRADDIAQVVDAVVASGSPVPVLPEHVVTLSDGCEVPLVDGGFAHNEPIEAARYLGAHQVLLVRSQPDPEALRRARAARDGGLPFPSRLVSNLGGILPFLFDRSQQLDRTVARSMLVAYVAPDPRHGAFPLLTDFRRPVIERMIEAADEDSLGLVGRVQSWGVPKPTVSVTARGASSP